MSAATVAAGGGGGTPAVAAVPTPTYPFLHLSPGCVVCIEALVSGSYPIRLGAGCIVHPRARLDSTRGPITLGANNIVEELAAVIAPGAQGVVLGDYNVLRVGCCVQASMGSANVIECRAHVTEEGSLGDGCVVGPTLVVAWPVPSHSVLHGAATGAGSTFAGAGAAGGAISQRRKESQMQANIEDVKAKDVLRDLLAKTHRLMQ